MDGLYCYSVLWTGNKVDEGRGGCPCFGGQRGGVIAARVEMAGECKGRLREGLACPIPFGGLTVHDSSKARTARQ